MSWERIAELDYGWELWTRGDLDAVRICHASTQECIDLPGDKLKSLAREHLQAVVERVVDELDAELDQV